MFRSASRSVLRGAQSSLAPARTIGGRRFVSTDPPHLKSRSWKSSALRWGVALGGIYFYNTSPLFADKQVQHLLHPTSVDESEPELSLDELTSPRRPPTEKQASILRSAASGSSEDGVIDASLPVSTDPSDSTSVSSPGALEAEAEGEGAFNPETGEINWDCPCLGGMAHGPCGPEFREAFSCFVFSKEEPKGMDCIDKFQTMQNCFRQYPDVYKGELEDDEELDEALESEKQELQRETAERRDALEKKQQQEQQPAKPQLRLLEVEGPGEARPAKKPAPKATVEVARDADAGPSTEPHPGMSSEHEAIYEGQSSQLLRVPQTRLPEEVVDDGVELVPRALYPEREESASSKSESSKTS